VDVWAFLALSSYAPTSKNVVAILCDGPKIFPDEVRKRLSSPEEAIDQAKLLAAELRKTGEFCRSDRVFVVDENGHLIFECRASCRT
jgi:hypothetical protein